MEVVAFDFGGVLVDWDPRHLYRSLFEDEAAMEDFLATVCTSEWNDRLDRGRPFAEGVAELVERFPDQAELITAYHERWPEMVRGEIDGTVGVLDELRGAGVPTYVLSNASAETWPHAVERFPFLSRFDGVLLSGEVGVAKPDPEIFDELCRRFHLRPESTIFIDDRAVNVDAARALGFTAHHFSTAEALRAELVRLGLLPPA
ncbi:MAG TPA: HAD family phosphatase [Acidimicrobiales bacterium]|nr:HAD family phosphatase [Acidimicrobiales bacterium]